MQQKLYEMVEIPVYTQCPVCGERYITLYTDIEKDNIKKITPMMPHQLCNKCCENGWRHSIDGDVVRLRFIYDSTEPWVIKDYVVIDRLRRSGL